MSRIIYMLVRRFPQVKSMLQRANISETPEFFMKKVLILSTYTTIGIGFLFLFGFLAAEVSIFYMLIALPIIFFLSFSIILQYPTVLIRQKEREINKEVLFAGRYILVKLDSGIPLYNALIDASQSYGISAKYFKEIVDEIRLGTPIETALEKVRNDSPSKYFKLILSELITSIKTGVDVTIALREVLSQITKEQILEIKEYAKKLNAFIMMYMVVGIIMPSLGMTMFMLLAGFAEIQLNFAVTSVLLTAIALSQYMFLSMLKSMRPMVNL